MAIRKPVATPRLFASVSHPLTCEPQDIGYACSATQDEADVATIGNGHDLPLRLILAKIQQRGSTTFDITISENADSLPTAAASYAAILILSIPG